MNEKIKKLIATVIILIVGSLLGVGVTLTVKPGEDPEVEVLQNPTTIEFSGEDVPAIIENDKGELVEDDTIETVESIDGGRFEDKDMGISDISEDQYADLGAIEEVDTATPEAFRDSTFGRCIIANNIYGAQCVSLARAFWWDYADRDVSTCGTGLAKGMMNCAEKNAGDDFEVIYDVASIIKGTWVVTDGTYTGHICMAMGPVVNGYVACLGENQNGPSCGSGIGGSATNIVNLSMKNFIGGYIPKTYIPQPEPEPEPEPEPTPVSNTCERWVLKWGDTLGAIMKACEGKVTWGKAMNEYARSWVDEKTGVRVFDGWNSADGIGLYAGHTIVKTQK